MIHEFLNILFDKNDSVYFTPDLYYGHVIPRALLSDGVPNKQFFSINPVQTKRTDADVTKLRNILVEFDKLDLNAQQDYVTSIAMPYSTKVFSGNKSYHYIISLEEPCLGLPAYKKLVKRILDKVVHADRAVSNPSRLSRTPGASRAGIEQRLMEVKKRVSLVELESWLGPAKEWDREIEAPMGADGKRLLPMRTMAFIKYGVGKGMRNQALFANACELFRANYTKSEIYDIAVKVLDLSEQEILQTIASAERAVRVE